MTIGDLDDDGGVNWAYYGGGWDNASGNTRGRGWTDGVARTARHRTALPAAPSQTGRDTRRLSVLPGLLVPAAPLPLRILHRYNTAGGPDRVHLQDEEDFFSAVANGQLPQVSFVKPVGSENEHPATPASPMAVTTSST
jgi:phospholipase C